MQCVFPDTRHLPRTGKEEWEKKDCASHGGASEQRPGHGCSGTAVARCDVEVGFLLSGGLASDAIAQNTTLHRLCEVGTDLEQQWSWNQRQPSAPRQCPAVRKKDLEKGPCLSFWCGRKGSEKGVGGAKKMLSSRGKTADGLSTSPPPTVTIQNGSKSS